MLRAVDQVCSGLMADGSFAGVIDVHNALINIDLFPDLSILETMLARCDTKRDTVAKDLQMLYLCHMSCVTIPIIKVFESVFRALLLNRG